MKPADLRLGSLTVDNDRGNRHTVQVVQLAVDTQWISLLSFVAPQNAAQSVVAMFNSGQQPRCLSPGFGDGGYIYPRPNKKQYHIRRHRLDYGQLQITMWLRDKNFMPAFSEDALWARLSSDDFTTPVLREWVPWLAQEMCRDDIQVIKFDTAFQCQPAHLRLTQEFFDDIVQKGIQKRKLTIPQETK